MVYVPATGKSKPVEEEIITEENVYDRPDESMSFFPGQVLKDTYVFTFLLVACAVLSYAAPAPLTATPTIRHNLWTGKRERSAATKLYLRPGTRSG